MAFAGVVRLCASLIAVLLCSLTFSKLFLTKSVISARRPSNSEKVSCEEPFTRSINDSAYILCATKMPFNSFSSAKTFKSFTLSVITPEKSSVCFADNNSSAFAFISKRLAVGCADFFNCSENLLNMIIVLSNIKNKSNSD